jgi:hypothetical protein
MPKDETPKPKAKQPPAKAQALTPPFAAWNDLAKATREPAPPLPFSPIQSPPVAPPVRGEVPSTVVKPDPEKPSRVVMGADGRVRLAGAPAELPPDAPRAYIQVARSQVAPAAPAAPPAAELEMLPGGRVVVRKG